MMDMICKAVESISKPDLRYTWAQAPVKFEDALGRIMPVPSEYDWDVSRQKFLLFLVFIFYSRSDRLLIVCFIS